MYTLHNIEHAVIAALYDGNTVNLAQVCERIGIEEAKNEIACRLNLTVRNVLYKADTLLIEMMRMVTTVYVFAYVNGIKTEVFRGRIWKVSGDVVKNDKFTVTCYDDLMYLNKSKDFAFYPSGTGTKTVVTGKLPEYGIPLGGYDGPDVSHEKLVFSKKTPASMMKETLADAELRSGARCVMYMFEGKFYVRRFGTNETMYKFTEQNCVSGDYSESILNLVTKVLVIGKEDDDGRRPIETTATGDMQYGVLLDVVVNNEETFVDAKADAENIIKEKGKPEEKLTIQTINIPTVHKGDVHYVAVGAAVGYCRVLGVSHDIRAMTMTMEVELFYY